MDQATVQRVIGIVALAYVGYTWWGITGVILVVGLALCSKI